MDPDEALKRAREALALFQDSDPDSNADRLAAGRLADYFEALDEWLSKGGFLPAAWQKGR